MVIILCFFALGKDHQTLNFILYIANSYCFSLVIPFVLFVIWIFSNSSYSFFCKSIKVSTVSGLGGMIESPLPLFPTSVTQCSFETRTLQCPSMPFFFFDIHPMNTHNFEIWENSANGLIRKNSAVIKTMTGFFAKIPKIPGLKS